MAKSNYITRQGWLAPDQELKFWWKEERPKLPKRFQMLRRLVTAVKTQNIFMKRRLREIDRRAFSFQTIRSATNRGLPPKTRRQSIFGAWVRS